jgi:hypothetical protein
MRPNCSEISDYYYFACHEFGSRRQNARGAPFRVSRNKFYLHIPLSDSSISCNLIPRLFPIAMSRRGNSPSPPFEDQLPQSSRMTARKDRLTLCSHRKGTGGKPILIQPARWRGKVPYFPRPVNHFDGWKNGRPCGEWGVNKRYLVESLSHEHPVTKFVEVSDSAIRRMQSADRCFPMERPKLPAFGCDVQPAILRSLIASLKGASHGSCPILEDHFCCRGRKSPLLRSAGAVSASRRPTPSLSFRLGIGCGFLGVPSSLRSIAIIFSRSEEIKFHRPNN